MNARDTLAGSLLRREHTSVIADAILDLDPLGLPGDARRALVNLSGGRPRYWASDDFDRPVAADRQVATWFRLFNPGGRGQHTDPADPGHLRDLVAIGLNVLDLGIYDNAQAALRAHATTGLKGSVRKRLRFLARLEKRANALEDSWRLRWAQMQAKSRLAYLIDADRLDDLQLAYVAYVAARANRRSEFVLGPQSRMKDEIVESLEAALMSRDGDEPPTPHEQAAWAEIALVRPVPDVFARCTPEDRGRLIGVFHGEMADAAAELARLYGDLPERMRAEMVMVKGVDSSRWNAYAGALNSMRSAWLGATLAAGLDTRDEYLPGKAPRLMASDLAHWYRSTGMDLHEDTTLFAALPKPWDVVLGRAHLTRGAVEVTAHNLGVDVSTGWTGPRRGDAPERSEPEPALVHGIAVEDPQLAETLRRCGVFSGKALRELDRLPDGLVRAEVTDGRRTRVPVLGAAVRERERR